MITLHNINRNPKSVKKRKKVGRGCGSGHGKTSCRGHKGQKARSGGKIRPGFEGGQMPLYRRLPKKGFSNMKFKKVYSLVNIGTLQKMDQEEITPDILYKNKKADKRFPVKILGMGELDKKLDVKSHKISKTAKQKIESAGGKWEEI